MTSATCEYLGDTIHLLRLEHNMTMEELAQKVGVTKATISRWESGEIQCVRSDKVKKLASVFGMTADELLSDKIINAKPVEAKLAPERERSLAIIGQMLKNILDMLEMLMLKERQEQKKQEQT